MNWAVILGAIAFWLAAWWFNTWLARRNPKSASVRRALRLAVPALFGITLLVLWEGITRGANVPTVLLPPPSMIGARFAASTAVLWADFQQTFMKAVPPSPSTARRSCSTG
jgi:NitT/TauT family transport system permease protein